jgi:hypothetical protein
MKARTLGIVVLMILIVAVALSVTVPAALHARSASAAPAAAAVPAAVPDHPEIREALAALRRAKDHLEHAAHDFNGHRVDAIHATDEAIRQLEICLKFDK